MHTRACQCIGAMAECPASLLYSAPLLFCPLSVYYLYCVLVGRQPGSGAILYTLWDPVGVLPAGDQPDVICPWAVDGELFCAGGRLLKLYLSTCDRQSFLLF